MKTLTDAKDQIAFLFTDELEYEPALLIPKKKDRESTLRALARAAEVLRAITPFTHDPIKVALEALAEEIGWSRSEVNGAAIRVAVTGRTVGPPLYESLELLGKERALTRIEAAREALAGGRD